MMASHALLESPMTPQCSPNAIERAILSRIDECEVISLDTMVALLPHYTWNQIFHAVDRLARQGKIVLRRHRFDYSLFSTRYAS